MLTRFRQLKQRAGGAGVPLKTVILDRDGTLYDDVANKVQPGIPEMLTQLKDLGLNLFFASNEARDPRVEQLLGFDRDHFLYHTECGNKGSKGYVEAAMAMSGSERHQIAYLGDSVQDMWEASNTLVPFFNADWSNPGYGYGIPIWEPSNFPPILKTFLLKEHPWYFVVDDEDAIGRPLHYRALLDPTHAINLGIRDLVKGWANDSLVQAGGLPYKLSDFLALHLVGSIITSGMYLDRVTGKKPLLCIYPGHDNGHPPVLETFLSFTAKQCNVAYLPNLLVRHTHTESSRERKLRNLPKYFATQINTVMVNPELAHRIRGNVVTVVDDFSSDCHSMEASRNFLYACGAEKVVGVTVAKYGARYDAFTPVAGYGLPTKGGVANAIESNFTLRRAQHNTILAALEPF
jgi:hypothetical protein